MLFTECLVAEITKEEKTEKDIKLLTIDKLDPIILRELFSDNNSDNIKQNFPALKTIIITSIATISLLCLLFLVALILRILSGDKSNDFLYPDSTPILFEDIPNDYQPPLGAEIKIAGSISMIPLNRILKKNFIDEYRGVSVEIDSSNSGSNAGVEKLCNGEIDIAASSADLSSLNQGCEGLKAVEVYAGALTIVVGKDNPITNLRSEGSKRYFQM